MSGKFSAEDLEVLQIDPRQPCGHSVCPSCGGDLLVGIRKDVGNVMLAHSAYKDPTDPTGTRFVSGCAVFTGILHEPDVIQRLYKLGARFRQIT